MDMTTTMARSEWAPRRSRWALGALASGGFVVGSAELLVVGVLSLIAQDMAVSTRAAGTLVTAYELGVSLGGPALAALSMRLDRRLVLSLALAVYLAGNALTVVTRDFGTLLFARVVMGASHGLFIGIAFAVAASLVTPERRGRAISAVFSGLAASTALGVPLGTLVAHAMGWRAAFVAVGVLGLLVLVSARIVVPSVAGMRGAGGLAAKARAAFAPRVLAVLAVGFLLMGGQFTALTYLTPYLQGVAGISGPWVGAFLMAFGLATAVGAVLGGRAADRNASATLVVANVLLIIALGVLYLAGEAPSLVALALGAWGLVGFGLVPSLQLRVIRLAGAGGDLAATLPASAITAGIAAGALVGGWALARYGVASVVVASLVCCAIALPVTWATGRLKVPTNDVDEEGARRPLDAGK